MHISVIIPTCNRARFLASTLDSLARQSLNSRAFEILVVDNGSTDNTKAVFEGFQASQLSINTRYVWEPVPGLLSGRHRGVDEAKSDLLVFIDDDIIADPGWLKSVAEGFDDRSVGIIGGPSLPHYEGPVPTWESYLWNKCSNGRICGTYSLLDLGPTSHDISPRFVWGLNYSIRRELVKSLGGFHPDCIPAELQRYQGDGETGLSVKAAAAGIRARYEVGARVRHVIPTERLQLKYLERRAFYQGVSDSYTALRREHGLYPQSSSKPTLAERLLGIGRHLKSIVAMTSQERIIRRINRVWTTKGYQFHRDAIAEDPNVLRWALRKDYWDYHYAT